MESVGIIVRMVCIIEVVHPSTWSLTGIETQESCMKFIKTARISGLALALLTATLSAHAMGGRETSAGTAKEMKPIVAVSIQPQAYFVQRLAGDRLGLLTLVGPGQSPHSYEPTPRQMADLSQAKVWFSIGVEFENALMPKIESL
jgi:ABC-type Zn uptake system ZnuABC Zn-binding protein ZnuA